MQERGVWHVMACDGLCRRPTALHGRVSVHTSYHGCPHRATANMDRQSGHITTLVQYNTQKVCVQTPTCYKTSSSPHTTPCTGVKLLKWNKEPLT